MTYKIYIIWKNCSKLVYVGLAQACPQLSSTIATHGTQQLHNLSQCLFAQQQLHQECEQSITCLIVHLQLMPHSHGLANSIVSYCIPHHANVMVSQLVSMKYQPSKVLPHARNSSCRSSSIGHLCMCMSCITSLQAIPTSTFAQLHYDNKVSQRL